MSTLSAPGSNKETHIDVEMLDDVAACSTPTIKTEETQTEQNQITSVNYAHCLAFVKYEEKEAVTITPEDHKKRRAEPEGGEVLTLEVTKTISEQEGVIAKIVKTTETVTKLTKSTKLPKLNILGFTSVDDKSKVFSIYEGKLVTKKPAELIQVELSLVVDTFAHNTSLTNNDPLDQAVAKMIRKSNVIYLNVKDVKEDITEPQQFVFDGVESYPGSGQEEDIVKCKFKDVWTILCCSSRALL